MRLKIFFSALLLAGLSAACVDLKIGEPISVRATQMIRPGFTTKDEVTSSFGQPLRNVPGPEGDIWVYRYLDGRGKTQELTVSFTGDVVSVFKTL